jgi:phosphoribosylaminoimidazole-succinocarboxamide synthase
MSNNYPNQINQYQGKVRNVYMLDNERIVMEASDRISAFDVILPEAIPYKGQVLNQIAAFMLQKTAHLCPNWFIAAPTASIAIGKLCTPFKIEVVVRGYLSGHAWRTYNAGVRVLCGVQLPDGLKENDKLPKPIITPSTKAAAGHDEDITEVEIINQKLATAEQWEQIKKYALAIFEFGQNWANQQGLILVDTKYEFGLYNNIITLMDEIHTPDSSRYFYLTNYKVNQAAGSKQEQLSKEFVREWLIANNFMGKEGQIIPEMTKEKVTEISERYIQLYEKLTGEQFIKSTDDLETQRQKAISYLQTL